MQLTSGQPFWGTRNGILHSYPSLQTSLATEIVVLGGGITGAIIADHLTAEGREVVVLDRRDIASGSTSASTALLQYEIDTPLRELARQYGEDAAVGAYRACLDAIDQLAQLDRSLGGAGRFSSRNSLYIASTPQDVPDLQQEFELRLRHGFPVEYWDAATLAARFDFSGHGGIYSLKAAQMDPVRMCDALLQRVRTRGGRVYDRTRVVEATGRPDRVQLTTAEGHIVRARCAIVAMGFESQAFLPSRVAQLINTFAFVTEPVDAFPGWFEQCLIWETARPYLYLRTTDDQRIMAGGGDIRFESALIRDALLQRRTNAIADRVRQMLPRLPLTVDYRWGGTFAETPDGLPFIGAHPARPGLLFAMCYGGNGITYSAIAASLVSAWLSQQDHPLRSLFGFGREPQTAQPSRRAPASRLPH